MLRSIDNYLTNWSIRKDRKVLLLRGARQVGKTYSVRTLGKRFRRMVEVNLDLEPKVHAFFSGSLDPFQIVKNLEYYLDTAITPGETLLFLDEAQACPDALRSLRYFYEKMPDLHVVAAGSLLEFALGDIPSFGVGRIESCHLHPMSFAEFLTALGHEASIEPIRHASPKRPIEPVLHEKLLERMKVFQLIGGMPEAVARYVDDRDLRQCRRVLDTLLGGLETDFAKYKARSPVARLRETLAGVAIQSGAKFKYTAVGDDSSALYRNALELLVKAGLVYRSHHATGAGVPLGAGVDPRRFKAVLFDTGIYQRLMRLDLADYVTSDFKTLVNRGPLAELAVGNELVKGRDPEEAPELYYWHREARGSMAEVDYLIEKGGRVIPIEVKAGTGAKMKSLRLFIEEKKAPFGIRFSADNFSRYGAIVSIPLYAAGFCEAYEWLA